ncbi:MULTISPECIES: homing endonuclease associated repeat-containing protein [Bacillus]|uniref:homing endonuclease associated repeat-containing protein n=1 Tax=Bacillus TaxID=1386 RepID=UPI001CC9D4DA|nr:hypothetical protein K9N56_24220 [Bacillus sp. PM8313]
MYTKEQLINILRQKAKELGRSPKRKEVKQFQTIVKQFGSFREGLKEAGLPLNRRGRKSNVFC